MRLRISPAALLVNVTAKMLRALIPFCNIQAMRQVMTRVLPEPGPARTSNGPSVCKTASRWFSVKLVRMSSNVAGIVRVSTGVLGADWYDVIVRGERAAEADGFVASLHHTRPECNP